MNDGSLQVQCPQRLKREHPTATHFLRTMSDYDDHRMHLKFVVVLLNFHCTKGSTAEELDLDHQSNTQHKQAHVFLGQLRIYNKKDIGIQNHLLKNKRLEVV